MPEPGSMCSFQIFHCLDSNSLEKTAVIQPQVEEIRKGNKNFQNLPENRITLQRSEASIWLVYTLFWPRTPASTKITTKTGQTEPLNCQPKVIGNRGKMNKTSSKEATTLSCLQKFLCVPSYRSFQFFSLGTFYNPVFFTFWVSSISFPLTSHRQSNILNTFSSSNPR